MRIKFPFTSFILCTLSMELIKTIFEITSTKMCCALCCCVVSFHTAPWGVEKSTQTFIDRFNALQFSRTYEVIKTQFVCFS